MNKNNKKLLVTSSLFLIGTSISLIPIIENKINGDISLKNKNFSRLQRNTQRQLYKVISKNSNVSSLSSNILSKKYGDKIYDDQGNKLSYFLIGTKDIYMYADYVDDSGILYEIKNDEAKVIGYSPLLQKNQSITIRDFIVVDRTIYNVTEVESYAFYFEDWWNSIIKPNTMKLSLSNNLKTIGEYAFSVDLASLSLSIWTGDLIIPDSVIEIGASAFAEAGFTGNCILSKNLDTIKMSTFVNNFFSGSLLIPKNIKSVNPFAFSLSANLKDEARLDSIYYYETSSVDSGNWSPFFNQVSSDKIFVLSSNEISMLKTKYDASIFGLQGNSSSEIKNKINVDWLYENKSKLFNNESLVNKSNLSIESISDTQNTIIVNLSVSGKKFSFEIINFAKIPSLQKSQFRAIEFGWIYESLNEGKNIIDIDWVYENKQYIFDNNELIDKSNISNLQIQSTDNELNVSLMINSNKYSFTISDFYSETQIIKTKYDASDFGLENKYVFEIVDLIDSEWIFNNKNIILSNSEYVTKDMIQNVKVSYTKDLVDVKFNIRNLLFEFTISNYKNIALMSSSYEAIDFGWSENLVSDVYNNINAKWIFENKAKILVDSQLFTNENVIENVTPIKDDVKRSIDVSFEMFGNKYSFKINNFMNVQLKKSLFEASEFNMQNQTVFDAIPNINSSWIYENASKLINVNNYSQSDFKNVIVKQRDSKSISIKFDFFDMKDMMIYILSFSNVNLTKETFSIKDLKTVNTLSSSFDIYADQYLDNINANWIYERRDKIFDNASNLPQDKLTDVKTSVQANETAISITFKANDELFSIEITGFPIPIKLMNNTYKAIDLGFDEESTISDVKNNINANWILSNKNKFFNNADILTSSSDISNLKVVSNTEDLTLKVQCSIFGKMYSFNITDVRPDNILDAISPNKGVQTGLIVGGVLVLVGGIALVIAMIIVMIKKRKNEEDQLEYL